MALGFTKRNGGDTVKAGFYWNRGEWEAQIVSGEGGVLKGDSSARFVRVPLLAVLALAPIMGAAYAMFLPFIGIAMVVMYLMGRLRAPRLSTPPAAVAKFPVTIRTPHNVQAVEDARADEIKRAA